MQKYRSAAMLLLTSLLGSGSSSIWADDIKGARNHPLVAPYFNSRIVSYRFSEFDEAYIRIGKTFRDDAGALVEPKETLSGKLTSIVYQSTDNAPLLQVLSNYSSSLKQAGFRETFSCTSRETCGLLFVLDLMDKNPIHRGFTYYPRSTDSSNGDRFGYWSGRLSRPGGDLVVGVLVGEDSDHEKKIASVVDILELKPMQTGLVAINPNFLSDSLQQNGKAVLSGIFFDTDQATLKPESHAALKAIADYLSQNRQAKVFIVGHTDNVGDYGHNVDLSSRRAAAVAAALATDFKTDAKRLQAIGVGPVAPISSNASEADRAGNRRVEMVLRY